MKPIEYPRFEQKYLKHQNDLFQNEKGFVRGLFNISVGERVIVVHNFSELLCQIVSKNSRGSKVKVLGHKFNKENA